MRFALAPAAVLAAAAGALPAPLAVAVLAPTFLLTPGLLAARHAFAGKGREGAFASALALSPFLSGAPLVALLALGVPLPVAARVVALCVAVLALALPAAGGRTADDGGSRVAWVCAAAWTTLVAALLVGNRWLPPRADGWYHAAATLQVLQRGIPPEDPYFAGVRMLYFWGVHAWAAAWLALAPRLSVYTPFVAFNLSGAFAVVLAMASFARRLGAGAAGIALTAALTTLGYSPFGWVLVAGHAAFGHDRGWAVFAGAIGRGASPVLFSLAEGQLHGSLAFFGDKYLVLTQFSMALALFALAVVALLDLVSAPGTGTRAAIAFGLLTGATLFIHTIVGYCLVLATAVVWLSLVPGALRGGAGGAARRRALALLALATAAAVIVLSPYLLEITLGKHGQVHTGVSAAGLRSLVLGGLFVVIPGFAWLAARARRSPDAARVLLVGATCTVLALTLRLYENNQVKFFNLLFLLLSAPAAMGWLGALRDRGRVVRVLAALVLVTGAVPTAAIAVAGFAAEHGQSPDGWHPPTAEVAAAMEWARGHTPADAAFCDLGGGREVLTLAGRCVLWGGYGGERDYGYDSAAIHVRRETAGALCRGLEPGPRGDSLLAALHREVVVMTRADAPDSNADHGALARHPERFTPLWQNAAVGFWRVRVP